MAYPGLGADYATEINRLQRQLHDLNVALNLATRAGQTAAVAQFKQQRDALLARINQLIAAQKEIEGPSALAVGVSNIFEPVARAFRSLGIGATIALAAIALVAVRGTRTL